MKPTTRAGKASSASALTRSITWQLMFALGAIGCSPAATPAQRSPRTGGTADHELPRVEASRRDAGRALFHISDHEVAALDRMDGGVGDTDAGPGVAVSPDAGVNSAEVAWLVLHLADEPEHAIPTDTPAVRALAARGPEGVRAVLPLLGGGDPDRAPFARRVVERVVMRACRDRGTLTGRRLARWLETGVEPEDEELGDAGVGSWWEDPPDRPFSTSILARIRGWADVGAPCEERDRRADSPPGPDGGTFAGADATADAVREVIRDASVARDR